MKKFLLGCGVLTGLTIILLLVFLVIGIFAGIYSEESIATGEKVRFKKIIADSGSKDFDKTLGKIARVDITSVITNTPGGSEFSGESFYVDELKKLLKKIRNNDDMKAVIFRITSPGGEITACDILHQEILKLKKKKKIVVYMEGLAASGGYYISAPADHIIASPTTVTGSIGVIAQAFTFPKLIDKLNIKPETFKSGKSKDSLSPFREITESERQHMQGIIDSLFDKFIQVVSEGRKIPAKKLRNITGDGRVVLADEAKKLKLIDSIGYIEDAYAKARKIAGIEGAPVINYKREMSFFELFSATSTKIATKAGSLNNSKIKIDWQGSLSPMIKPGHFYYLPPQFNNYN